MLGYEIPSSNLTPIPQRSKRRRLCALASEEPLAMSASSCVLKINCQSHLPKHALALHQTICALAITVVLCQEPCCCLIYHQAWTGHTEHVNPTMLGCRTVATQRQLTSGPLTGRGPATQRTLWPPQECHNDCCPSNKQLSTT